MKVKVSPGSVAGDVDEGYGKLADVFRRNMTSGQEIGAAVAVYRDGAKVVDLWGGYRNGITKAPWQEDTLVTVFSTRKGVSSLAVAVAASQGLISYDAKVADYLHGASGADPIRNGQAALVGPPHRTGYPSHGARSVRGHGPFRCQKARQGPSRRGLADAGPHHGQP